MARKKRSDDDQVLFRWTVAGGVALLALLAFGEFLVDHPDLVKHERAALAPMIDRVPD
jgi:hypothetical protein